MIRFLFGDNVLKDYGIIVMTRGGQFENDAEEEEGMSFSDWCGEQSGDFRELFRECGGRCVLFKTEPTTLDKCKRSYRK
jgi:hypothetical protein